MVESRHPILTSPANEGFSAESFAHFQRTPVAGLAKGGAAADAGKVPTDTSVFKHKAQFIIRLGKSLHQCGASSDRIERHLSNTTEMLGFHGTFLVSPTSFTCALWQEDAQDQHVFIERFGAADHNLGRLWEIDRLVESMAVGSLGFEEGEERLKAIVLAPRRHSRLANTLSMICIGAAFAMIVSPAPIDAIASGAISLLIYFICLAGAGKPEWKPVVTIAAAFTAGLLATTLDGLGLGVHSPLVVLSSVIIFVPGMALATALTEISTGHPISGSSRLVDAAMTFLMLVFGAFSGAAVAAFPGILIVFHPVTSGAMPPWIICPALLILSLGLGVVFDIPWSKMLWGVLASAIAFGASRFGESHFGIHAGMFLGALGVGLFGNLFARITRGPGSIVTTQGVILLVPGSKTYSIINHWISGEDVLPHQSGALALLAFIALIAGLLFANAILPPRKSL